MLKVTTQYDDRGLTAFITGLPSLRDDYAEGIARQIEVTWRTLAHRITGAYRASIYVQTHDGSEYAGAAVEARVLNPRARILPQVAKPPVGGATVASCVNYAAFEELGTSRRAGHPAFVPAVQGVKGRLPQIKPLYRKGR